MIWNKKYTLNDLVQLHRNTMQEYIGIEFLEIGDDFLKAKMPCDNRTKQPMGLLHGGANVTLAESLGSLASVMCIDMDKKACVGLEINANHIRAVRSGYVTGIARPIHIGRMTQIWEIKIYDEQDKLTCISRITNAILDKA